MRLIFRHRYKSITQFEPIDLPSFTVLTGVNGAGKSHLLEAIESNAVSIEGIAPNEPNGPKRIRRLDAAMLIPQDTGAFSSGQISSEQSTHWAELASHKAQQLQNLHSEINGLGLPWLESLDVKALTKVTHLDLEQHGIAPGSSRELCARIKDSIDRANEAMCQQFVRGDPQNRPRLIAALRSSTAQPLIAIDQNGFYDLYPRLWQPVDLFQQSFARLFSAYQRQWIRNRLKEVGRAEGEDLQPLTEQEFRVKYGQPPWQFVNEILASAELSFRINEPYKWDDRQYEPLLTDEKSGVKVRFNDLSSGERVIMSFALCMYHAAEPSAAVDFPSILLFDEVDAPLHPSMTRSLLRAIQLVLVEKHRIQVILTTHSPSTVALAPEESIYVMTKREVERLSHTTKDRALGVLTSGVPTLSVNYENRRQVFVESKYDVIYYSYLYQSCRSHLQPHVSLMFIASGPGGNGGCEQVKSLVTQLVAGGNKTVRGVIDWDGKNGETNLVSVLCKEERYSIENVILDPFLLGLLLIREKFREPQSLGLPREFRYVGADALGPSQVQCLVNAIVDQLDPEPEGADRLVFRYANGLEATVPKSIAHWKGHALEARVKEVFAELQRFRQEADLKEAILTKVLGDFPQFVPLPVVELFTRLQAEPLND